jgi:hypothetical protein
MIELTMSDGSLALRHYATSPLVYLDHWALMDISEHHADEFVAGLIGHRGTLALSWVNFHELAETGDTTLDIVATLLRRIFPHVVFIDTEAHHVAEKENEMVRGSRTGSPLLHQEWLDLFYRWKRVRTLDPLSPDEFLEAFKSPGLRASLREIKERATAEMVEMFTAARDRVRRDNEVRRRLTSPLPMGDPRMPPTRFVFVQALKYLVRGNQNLQDGHHMQDFWHMVVPISYCDYVALDQNWREAARQVQEGLKSRKLLTHEAQVFDNVAELLAQLTPAGGR